MKNNDVLEYFVSKITLLQHKIDDLMVAVSKSRHDEILTDSENKKLIAENEQLKCDLEETQRLKMQFFNDWGRVCGQTEKLQEQINELECEHKEAVANYLGAANTMVKMYQIVTKNIDGGPKQGVIEDVEAKIEQYEAELDFLRFVWKKMGGIDMNEFLHDYWYKTGKNAPTVADFKFK